MTGYALAVLAVYAIIGAVVGAFAVPRIADMLLSRAYLRSYTWWYRCLDDFSRYRDAFPGRLPRQSEKGSAGAVGMWLEDCRSQALKGTLTHERAEALREAGIDVGKGPRREARPSSGDVVRFRRGRGNGRCLPRPWRCGSRPNRYRVPRGIKAACCACAVRSWRRGWCAICGQG